MKCLLLVVAMAVESQPPDAELARRYLAKAAPRVEKLPPSSAQAAEFHYRSMQQARQEGDEPAAREHADWLVANAAGSVYELSALIASAKAADEAVRAASGAALPPARQKALDIYRRLAAITGDSPEVISTKKNALVAHSKLADYASQTGYHAEAAEALEKILAAYPKDRGALRRAALAHQQAGDPQRALPRWRTLLAGLESESEAWYEAKYNQIVCLNQSDRDTARKVFDQFVLLHPKLGPEPWRAKFQSLARQIPRR